MSTFIVVTLLIAGMASVLAFQHQRRRRAIASLPDYGFPHDTFIGFKEGPTGETVTRYRLPDLRVRSEMVVSTPEPGVVARLIHDAQEKEEELREQQILRLLQGES